MDRPRLYAVLSGSLEFSSRSGTETAAPAAELRSAFSTLNGVFDGAFAPSIEIIEGEHWQMVTDRPAIALQAALYFRAELKARMGSHDVDTSVAIGAGGVTVVPRENVLEGQGPAYRRSLIALESMPRYRKLAMQLDDQPLGPGFDEMLGLVDCIAGWWTDKQALAITGALQGWTQEVIAQRWDRLAGKSVSQQTVAQHLQRAGWQSLEPAIEFLDGLLI